MIQGFIFDLDGVLVDTPDIHYKAWKKLTDLLDIGFTRNEYENLKGLGRTMSFQQILKWNNKVVTSFEFDTFLQQKNSWYLNLISENGNEIVLPGVDTFLKESEKQGLRLAVGSASKNARMILEQTGLTHYFEVIFTGNQTSNFKPHPEVFHKVAEYLEISPEELVVFEDSKAGVEAAKSGGFKCVGIGESSFLKRANLVLNGLDAIHPSQVLEKLNSK